MVYINCNLDSLVVYTRRCIILLCSCFVQTLFSRNKQRKKFKLKFRLFLFVNCAGACAVYARKKLRSILFKYCIRKTQRHQNMHSARAGKQRKYTRTGSEREEKAELFVMSLLP